VLLHISPLVLLFCQTPRFSMSSYCTAYTSVFVLSSLHARVTTYRCICLYIKKWKKLLVF